MAIAINGMGRIGRLVLRDALGGVARHKSDVHKATGPDIAPNIAPDIALVNDASMDTKQLAHLLEFDSLHGRWDADFSYDDTSITINGTTIAASQTPALDNGHWKKHDISVVLDCTGVFKSPEKLAPYFTAGIGTTISSAPIHHEDVLNIVVGVNDHLYDPAKHKMITAASCTTNCLAPVVKVIQEHLGIKHGQITTIHNPTNTNLVSDAAHNDLRRARSSLLSIQPTTTGSARAIGLIYPELRGKLNGHAVRVPVLNASLTDCVFELETSTSEDAVNSLFEAAAASGRLRGILGAEARELVSADYLNDTRSSIIDLHSTMVTNSTMLKIYSWYDNEMGYACRMNDLARLVLSKTTA